MSKSGSKSRGGPTSVDDGQLSLFETVDEQANEVSGFLNYVVSDRMQTTGGKRDDIQSARSIADSTAVHRESATLPPLVPDDGCSSPYSDVHLPTAVKSAVVERFPALAVHQSYKPGSTKARLVDILNQCLEFNAMPRSKRDRRLIDRREMAARLSVTYSLVFHNFSGILTDYEVVLEIVQPVATLPEAPKFGAKVNQVSPLNNATQKVVFQYPNLSKHQYYPEDSTANKIVQILNAQIVCGGLERSRGGKINRKLIAAQLGFNNSALAHYTQILEDYENEVGGKESATEAKIPAMRRWLEHQMDRRELLVRDGKIRRIQLFSQFGFPKNSLVILRYPRVAELVEEFDRRIAEAGYQPKEIVEKLRMLDELLEEPPVGKDGQTIDRTALSQLLGLSVSVKRGLPAKTRRAKVDDFCAARSGRIPPLPWTNFAPPFSRADTRGKQRVFGHWTVSMTSAKPA